MLHRHPLLEGIVDYAGLFPPAALAMAPAVEEYARQKASPEAWMLATFVVPVARLGEFATAAAAARAVTEPTGAWPLSLLLGPDPLTDLERAAEFAGDHPELGRVDAVEFRPAGPQSIATVAARAPRDAQLFCELPWDAPLGEWLAPVRASGAFAKLRTGGVTEDLVPPVEAIVTFLRACRAAGVGLKFTAGLHHPVRARHPLTYASDAPLGTMHGFVNVFCAAALIAGTDASDATLVEVLEETDPSAFLLHEDGSLRWRAHHLDASVLRRTRAGFARSFGSCSFAEPVHDLQTLVGP